MATETKFTSLKEFYPFYLTEHSNSKSRVLHFIGTGLVVLVLLSTLYNQVWSRLWYIPLIGYEFAWVGHFFFEKINQLLFNIHFTV